MKEAVHSIEREWFRLPDTASTDEIRNLKQLGKKGLYRCPYCEAELIVKSGSERGLYFSHRNSESCEDSKEIDASEKRYTKQTGREAPNHRTMVNIVYDELSVQARIRDNMQVEYGYKAKRGLSHFP